MSSQKNLHGVCRRHQIVAGSGDGLRWFRHVQSVVLQHRAKHFEQAVADAARNNVDRIDCLGTAFSMTLFHCDVASRAAVNTVDFPVHPDRGLIVVQHRQVEQPFNRCAFPIGQRMMQTTDSFQKRCLKDLPPAYQFEHLRGAPQRHHPRDQKISGEGDDTTAVLKWCGQSLGK